MIEFAQFLISDVIVLPLFEFLLGGFAIYGFLRDQVATGFAVVRREAESNTFLQYVFSAVFLFLAFEVVDSADAFLGYKTILHVYNFVVIAYLSLFCCWSRNKIIGLKLRVEQKQENLH